MIFHLFVDIYYKQSCAASVHKRSLADLNRQQYIFACLKGYFIQLWSYVTANHERDQGERYIQLSQMASQIYFKSPWISQAVNVYWFEIKRCIIILILKQNNSVYLKICYANLVFIILSERVFLLQDISFSCGHRPQHIKLDP